MPVVKSPQSNTKTMNHFNTKSLTFYTVVIGSVLLLFKTVTVYGEENLQAPPMIKGSYRLTLGKSSSECQQSEPLRLNLQQSGIYLNASLLPVNSSADTQKQSSLKGIFKNQQLSLIGEVDQTVICHIAPPHSIQAQMQLADDRSLQGKIIVSTIAQNLEFNATPEATQAEPQNSNSH